jgi:hypothetical protein
MQSALACAAGILIAGAVCAGQSVSPSYNHAELKKMIGEAHTAEQYNTLATYFESQEQNYEQKAVVERHEWHQLSHGFMTMNQRYPRPADASRNRYEYFSSKALQMNSRASYYQRLAANSQQ